jgi:hypothetical protein
MDFTRSVFAERCRVKNAAQKPPGVRDTHSQSRNIKMSRPYPSLGTLVELSEVVNRILNLNDVQGAR